MNFQIASIFIIQLLTFHEALTARVLSWSVDTSDPQNLTIGGTVKLKCTGPSCCSGSRSWIGGASSSTLMSNGVPINSSKYEEILDSNSFSLLIKHVAESDYNVSYQCFNKFDDSPSIELQPTNETFWYKPSQSDIKVISALDTIGGDVSFAVNVTKVFPDPDCEATIGSKTYLVQVITTDDPSVYMHCEVSMKDVIFSCPGSLRISCSAPPYVTFSINGGNPCSSTSDCKYCICIVICLLIVIVSESFITIILVLKISTEEHHNMERSKRFAASVVILVVCSSVAFVISIILSEKYEICSCNNSATIAFSVIPVVVVPLICSIIIWISLVYYNRPGITNFKMLLVVVTLAICLAVQWIRQIQNMKKVKPKKYNKITIVTKGNPPKRWLSCKLETLKSADIGGLHIHHKPINDENFKEIDLGTTQINSFELKTEIVGKEPYEMYISAIGIDWKSATRTFDQHDLEMDCALLQNSDRHITHVQWTHNGNPFHTECGASQATLAHLYASDTKTGKYVCTITFQQVSEMEKEIFTEIKEYCFDVKVCDKGEAQSVNLLENCILLETLDDNQQRTGVQWTHNENSVFPEKKVLYEGGNARYPALKVLYASKADSGKYACTVTKKNEKGTTEIKKYYVDLTVHDKKEMVKQLCECTLLEKLNSRSNIKNVQWSFEGNSIHAENSSVYTGGNKLNPALKVLYASSADSGEYVCTVLFGNEMGLSEEKQFYVDLKVCDATAMSVNLIKDCTLLEELQRIQLEHIMDVKWTRNEKSIQTKNCCTYTGGNKSYPALSILYASSSDSGEYVCTVWFKNALESAEKKYHVNLTVSDQNEAKSVDLLKGCTLLEELHSREHIHIKEVQWHHNGNRIPIEYDDIYEGGIPSQPGLTVRFASNADTGEYVCTVIFAMKEKDEKEANKQFIVNLTLSEPQQLEKIVKAGQNVQLLSEFKSVSSLQTVEWDFNKRPINIKNSCLYNGGNKTTPALTICYVSEDDTGKYVCTLSFHRESEKKASKIKKKFVILLKLESNTAKNVTEGKEVILLESLKRNEEDKNINSVEWAHDGKSITYNNEKYGGADRKHPSLIILNACVRDNGHYSCTLEFRKTIGQETERKQFSVFLEVKELTSKRRKAVS